MGLKEEEFSWENSFCPCEWEMRNSFMGTGNSSVFAAVCCEGGKCESVIKGELGWSFGISSPLDLELDSGEEEEEEEGCLPLNWVSIFWDLSFLKKENKNFTSFFSLFLGLVFFGGSKFKDFLGTFLFFSPGSGTCHFFSFLFQEWQLISGSCSA